MIEWQNDPHSDSDDTSLYANLHLTLPGSIRYTFSVSQEGLKDSDKSGVSGYLVVYTVLTLKNASGENLSVDGLLYHTVLTKNLGSFSEWRDILDVSKVTGYNMVHHTPIQALGSLNACYSLKDQVAVDPVFDSDGKCCTLDERIRG